MKRKKCRTKAAATVFLAALLAVGCLAGGDDVESGTAPRSARDAQSAGKAGAQLWVENCFLCHNSRPPSWYSDGEWEVAMHHMRVRANLTAEEHEKILEFLKAGN